MVKQTKENIKKAEKSSKTGTLLLGVTYNSGGESVEVNGGKRLERK